MKRVLLLGLGLFCVAACGGADQSSLLVDGGNNTGNDGGGPPDVTVPPQDSGPGPDVIVPDDVAVVDAVTVDAPVTPPDSKIHCGNSLTCDAKTEICCHHAFSVQQYQCVTSVSACSGNGDVPIGCSSNDNCVSQGVPSYVCCANIGGQGSGNCANSAIATDVSCQSDCTQQNQVPVGCDTQLQNCVDTQQQCITSQCTLPGYNICI